MPASGQKYLYERLNPQDFQLLVNAVMPHAFPGYRPLPLGQSDGGRDGIADVDGMRLTFQVKWSGTGQHKDPVSWLAGVIRAEKANLCRLASEGVRHYVLVTNVASTGRPKTGTFDRLNEKLDEYAKQYGFDAMTCVWREGLDGFLDSIPDEVKWAHADMLAGWDLIRYLITKQLGASRDRGLRDLVRNIAVTQWADDELVKFSQVDVDRKPVADLFIDVTGERLRAVEQPSRVRGHNLVSNSQVSVGGVAAHLIGTTTPATLVRGAPGQGKSTLSQFVCQVHRSAFLPESVQPMKLPTPKSPRFPLRADLSEYARWLQGIEVFEAVPTDASLDRLASRPTATKTRRSKKRPAAQSTLECFLGELMTFASGGSKLTVNDVHDLFNRLPSIVVFDGLDEVGSRAMRETVVDAIDRFTRRARSYPVPVQVVVTTRPSNNELPEPAADLFEVVSLNELTEKQRDEYLRKWCAVRDIRGKDGRELRKSFKAKSAEPYIAELAGNPMQLTILLELIHERGAATPTQRTDLYDHYVDLLLAREANKHPESVKKHREQLKEVVPFLGWYLQSRSEEKDLPGRMKVDELQAAMRHFQQCYGKPLAAVDELFEAATDRLWALTSKNQGTFEFEVLSLREYFAAHFLYRWAGEEQRHFDRRLVMRELLRRPLWHNTARFYGGNAAGGDIADLADGIIDEVQEGCTPQARSAAWTLVTDGVFQSRPRWARQVIDALLRDDAGIAALLDALGRNEVRPLPGLPDLPEADGPDAAWKRLTDQIAAEPEALSTQPRVRAVRELLNQRAAFATWWVPHMNTAAGTPAQNGWLELAASHEAAAGVQVDFDAVDLEQVSEAGVSRAAELVLNTGLIPTKGGTFETRLLQAVLDGECPDVSSIRSMPAQVAFALRPTAYISFSETGFSDVDERYSRRRSEAVTRLRSSAPHFARVASQRRFKQGQKGSTFPWSDTASALFDVVGRCWLASEIAIIGAASPHRNGFFRKPDAFALGPGGHPAELLAQTREHRNDVEWWREQLAIVSASDATELCAAEWAFALWAVPSGPVVSKLLHEWERVLTTLSQRRREVVLRAAWNIAGYGLLRSRPAEGTVDDESLQRLLEARSSGNARDETGGRRTRVKRSHTNIEVPRPQPDLPSLAKVARDQKWFKIDTVPAYY